MISGLKWRYYAGEPPRATPAQGGARRGTKQPRGIYFKVADDDQVDIIGGRRDRNRPGKETR